jgi:uncharacterized protein (DUF1501 family)
MSQVGHLNELHDKYYDKGLRIIAISNESPGVVKSKLIEGARARYWVGADPSGSMLRAFGGGGIPHAYLVDASGTIVANGYPTQLQFEPLLADAFDPALGRDLHPSLKALQKLYEKGEVGKAWAAAEKPASAGDDAARDARFLREKAEAYGAWRKRLVEKALEAKDYVTAAEDLEEISRSFAGMEVGAFASAKAKELAADEVAAKEVAAAQALRKARALEAKAEGKPRKLGAARNAYKAILQKYPGTKAAQLAQKALAALPE